MGIQILPENITNKIAAGEVIERPASVVKELVENSLDAGAGKVEVELKKGGTKLIRVVDDGQGMSREDLSLAFVSHATSKLEDEDDLFSVSTMGFRGEALSSIGAVSRAKITSRTRDSDEGHSIEVEGGVIGQVQAAGAPPGTQVEVRDLFYNVPVRRKFLKTTATEMAHISETLTRLALARPDVRFMLRHNDREVFNLPAADDRAQRIAEFFGGEIADELIPFEREMDDLTVEGYLCPPSVDRSNTKMQYTYVNGRYVRDRSLTHAIMEAYRGLMMSRRKPVCFLFLRVPPGEVDVNVHPTKIEVKFRKVGQVHNQLLEAMKDALREAKLTPQPSLSDGAEGGADGDSEGESVRQAVWDYFGSAGDDQDGGPKRGGRGRSGAAPARPVNVPREEGEGPLPSGRAVQVLDSYIVQETGEGLEVIDQHALHERLLYNRLKQRLDEGALDRQQLLVPELIELPKDEFYAIMDLQEELARFGISMDAFGDSTVIIRSYPQVLDNFDAEGFVREVLDEFEDVDPAGGAEECLERLLKVTACKGAVKADQRLSSDQLKRLLEQKAQQDEVDTCPHGRPTTILLSHRELEKQFKRR